MSAGNGEFTHADSVSLEKHLESRITALEAVLKARMEAMDKALSIADRQLDAHLEQLNNVRPQLDTMAATFIARNEWDANHKRVLDDVTDLKQNLLTLNGSVVHLAEWEVRRTYVDGCLQALDRWKATQEGKASQNSVMIAYAVSGVGLVLSVVGLIYNMLK